MCICRHCQCTHLSTCPINYWPTKSTEGQNDVPWLFALNYSLLKIFFNFSTIHCMDNGILYSYLIYFFLKLQLPQKDSSTDYDKTYNINYSWSNLLYLILDMNILYTIKCPSDQQYLWLFLKNHTEATRKYFFQGGGNPSWCKGTRNKKEQDKGLLWIHPHVFS